MIDDSTTGTFQVNAADRCQPRLPGIKTEQLRVEGWRNSVVAYIRTVGRRIDPAERPSVCRPGDSILVKSSVFGFSINIDIRSYACAWSSGL